MKKELKNYTSFKLTLEDIMQEARKRCMTEMYTKAQPSADYNEILRYYKNCKENNIKPEPIWQQHYLSPEEFKYILNKYTKAYHFEEQFKSNCDVIISDLKLGCNKDIYIPEIIENDGNIQPPQSSYMSVPPIRRIIGPKNAKRVINFIKERKNYYRFDHTQGDFSLSMSMGDAPSGSEKMVIDYWKTQGIDIKIDPRHYTEDDFWSEENGYFDEDDEVL